MGLSVCWPRCLRRPRAGCARCAHALDAARPLRSNSLTLQNGRATRGVSIWGFHWGAGPEPLPDLPRPHGWVALRPVAR